ncbi:MAG: hotdog fold domain-containing protein [Candidatus Poribacteria bacterium]|nr:hotdog fold domain-containing protein [Candidatus Poribacteria bacterium]
MNSELVASKLTGAVGSGLYKIIGKHWPDCYDPRQGDGTVLLNHILKFETFGEICPEGTQLLKEYQFRLVTTRQDDGRLKRGHVVMNCKLLNKEIESQPLVARIEYWMALSRLLAPRGERVPKDVPAQIAFLRESAPTEGDLVFRDIASYRCPVADDDRNFQDTSPHAFHIDRSDQFLHINTLVYMEQSLDFLALLYQNSGGNSAHLRFRELTIYFRKPFVPGQAAVVEVELAEKTDRFQGAVRFYHADGKGDRSERISTAILVSGPVIRF